MQRPMKIRNKKSVQLNPKLRRLNQCNHLLKLLRKSLLNRCSRIREYLESRFWTGDHTDTVWEPVRGFKSPWSVPYSLFFSQTSALVDQLEKYLAAAKSDAGDDDGKDTMIAIEQLERQLQHHYELACKKAEMQENQRSAVLKKLDSITAELQSHAIKVENGLEGKKEIINEMILLEKEAWQMIDNTPTLPNFDEINQVLENVSHRL